MEKENFIIDNINKADWALEKISNLMKKKKELIERYQKKLDRLNEWKDEEVNILDPDIKYFEKLIIEYYVGEKIMIVNLDLQASLEQLHQER